MAHIFMAFLMGLPIMALAAATPIPLHTAYDVSMCPEPGVLGCILGDEHNAEGRCKENAGGL
jgi:hypothetical protein